MAPPAETAVNPNEASISLPATVAQLNTEYGLDVSYQQVWQQVAAGTVPAGRQGARYRIRPSDLPEIARRLRAVRRGRVRVTRGAA